MNNISLLRKEKKKQETSVMIEGLQVCGNTVRERKRERVIYSSDYPYE